MKKIVSLIIATAITPLQAALYTEQNLRTIEAISALANTTTSALYAIAPEVDESVMQVRDISAIVNNLMDKALLEKSPMMRFSNILNTVAANESWHIAPQWDADFMKLFGKEFAVALARGISSELLAVAQNKIIDQALGNNPDRLKARAADLLASSITTTLNDAVFNYLDTKINGKEFDTSLAIMFAQTFYNELAFHIAGFIIAECADERKGELIPEVISLNSVE